MRQIFLSLLLLLLSSSCSQLISGRSPYSEIAHEDFSFFSPSEDFPVVTGDTGNFWNTSGEPQRGPASVEDVSQARFNRILRKELYELEGKQSDSDLELYEKYGHNLITDSEKIYFLKLPSYERRDYLFARGFIKPTKARVISSYEKTMAVNHQDVLIGMKKDDVMASLGTPRRVEIAGNPSHQNERWLYEMNGASKYIYFESGEVQGWE